MVGGANLFNANYICTQVLAIQACHCVGSPVQKDLEKDLSLSTIL